MRSISLSTWVFGALAAASVATVACSSTQVEDDSGQTEDAVQGGSVDSKHTFAVGIRLADGAVCSGVLIAPNLVMTAQHCVSASTGGKYVDCEKDQFASAPVDAPDVIVTTDARLPGRKQSQYKVDHVVVPESRELCGADIALLVLSKNVPASEAKPATPQLQAMTTDRTVSGKIAAIGYGLSSATKSDAGERRIKEDIPISCVPGGARDCDGKNGRKTGDSVREFRTTGGVCSGDSGSGAFEQSMLDDDSPKVLGILSRVTNRGSMCTDGVYTRTDMYATMIVAAGIKAAQVGKYRVPAWAQPKSEDSDDPLKAFEEEDDSTPTTPPETVDGGPDTPPTDPVSPRPDQEKKKKGGFFGDIDWGKVIDIVGGLIPKLTGSDDGKPREDNKNGTVNTGADAGADSGVSTTPSPQSELPKPAGGDRSTSESEDDDESSSSDDDDDSSKSTGGDKKGKKKAVESGGCNVGASSSSPASTSAALAFALLAARGVRRRRRD